MTICVQDKTIASMEPALNQMRYPGESMSQTETHARRELSGREFVPPHLDVPTLLTIQLTFSAEAPASLLPLLAHLDAILIVYCEAGTTSHQ